MRHPDLWHPRRGFELIALLAPRLYPEIVSRVNAETRTRPHAAGGGGDRLRGAHRGGGVQGAAGDGSAPAGRLLERQRSPGAAGRDGMVSQGAALAAKDALPGRVFPDGSTLGGGHQRVPVRTRSPPSRAAHHARLLDVSLQGAGAVSGMVRPKAVGLAAADGGHTISRSTTKAIRLPCPRTSRRFLDAGDAAGALHAGLGEPAGAPFLRGGARGLPTARLPGPVRDALSGTASCRASPRDPTLSRTCPSVRSCRAARRWSITAASARWPRGWRPGCRSS